MTALTQTEERRPLSRERVLRAAVELADREGLEGLSMRKLGGALGVEAMSLYNHVANKEDLLDGIVDVIVAEIELPPPGLYWKTALRQQMLNARAVILRHEWAAKALETRRNLSPVIMDYMEHLGATMRNGGFSIELLHHAMHALGSRAFGFAQEMFTEAGGEVDPADQAEMFEQMKERYPTITAVATQVIHDLDSVPGGMACDDNWEFQFATDLLLDGLERLLEADQRSG